eukprot:1149754-Pelagomonas_calceolata.AAC.6
MSHCGQKQENFVQKHHATCTWQLVRPYAALHTSEPSLGPCNTCACPRPREPISAASLATSNAPQSEAQGHARHTLLSRDTPGMCLWRERTAWQQSREQADMHGDQTCWCRGHRSSHAGQEP